MTDRKDGNYDFDRNGTSWNFNHWNISQVNSESRNQSRTYLRPLYVLCIMVNIFFLLIHP